MNDISSLAITLPVEMRLGDEQVEHYEKIIRDMAGTVCAEVATRKSHPSYGYTKEAIKAHLDNMEGAIGLYMVMTAQSMSPGVPALCKFGFPETTDRVRDARRVYGDLFPKKG
jgi:hypothetical protein